MKKLFCLLFVLVVCLCSVSFAESDLPALGSHYSLFLDARNYPGGKGVGLDYESLTIDLYLLDDESAGYVCVARCEDGYFYTSGFKKFNVLKKDSYYNCIYLNGEYFTAEYDENGVDLWVTYLNNQYRLHPVSVSSYFEDVR